MVRISGGPPRGSSTRTPTGLRDALSGEEHPSLVGEAVEEDEIVVGDGHASPTPLRETVMAKPASPKIKSSPRGVREAPRMTRGSMPWGSCIADHTPRVK